MALVFARRLAGSVRGRVRHSRMEKLLADGRTPMPQLSLIIAIYNKPEVLRLVLAACARQSFEGFEVIAADDGSGPEIADVIAAARELRRFSITHVWHERAGWRKNKMLNSAIRAAGAEYLAFIDGDCLPGKDFLLDHWNQRETKRVLCGRRVEMSERWARSLTVQKVASGEFERMGVAELIDGLRGKAARLEDGIRIRSAWVRGFRPVDSMLGSNFSAHKADLAAVNGFDETYDGPGIGEDADIQHRLALVGVTGKSLRNLAIQFHVYHPATRPSERSLRRWEMVKQTTNPRCEHGLDGS